MAEALSISPGTVSKALAPLRLPADIQALVNDGSLRAASAYEVSRLEGEEPQRELAHRVLNEGLKRDEAGKVVGRTTRTKSGKIKTISPVTSKTIAVGGATLTITWPKGSVSRDEVIEVLQQAIEVVVGEAG